MFTNSGSGFFVLLGIIAPPAQLISETLFKRQAMRHDCLSSLLVDGDKQSEKVFSAEKNSLYWTDLGPTMNQPRKDPFHMYYSMKIRDKA